MINVKFQGEIYPIKNELKEITINEFENICEISFKNINDNIDKWIEIFQYLGLPEKVCKNMDQSDLLIISSHFPFLNQKVNLKKIRKEIIINNEIIKFTNNDGKIKIKNLIDIEKYTEKNRIKYIAEMISVLYPNTNINKNEYIKSIRENLTMDYVLPIINYLNKEFFNGN